MTSAGKMDRLLSQLLEFSRIGTSQISQEKIDVSSIARSAYGDVAPDPAERMVKLEIAPMPPAVGDMSMIRQVFVNLLSNAIKFTGATKNARIEIRGNKGIGENIYLVRDNGVGFDMEYSHKLFRIFQRLHSEKEFPGTGAGLSIVKRIIEKHGGRIWAQGKPGKGATFYFTLPSA